MLVALLVCLIPTTIGGLLSAIGIAGIDRMVQKNVLAMSGRAVEAAGDVDVLLLDKTGTITLGDRQATEFIPAPGVTVEELADAAQLASLADETPEGRSIVVLAKQYGLRGRSISEMPGRGLHRLFGADPDERCGYRRHADPQRGRRRHHANSSARASPARSTMPVDAISRSGGTPLVVADERQGPGRRSISRTSSRAD